MTNNNNSLDKKVDLATTIAETVLENPKGVCPHCINKILEITKVKLEGVGGHQ